MASFNKASSTHLYRISKVLVADLKFFTATEVLVVMLCLEMVRGCTNGRTLEGRQRELTEAIWEI